jgi:TonB family protein
MLTRIDPFNSTGPVSIASMFRTLKSCFATVLPLIVCFHDLNAGISLEYRSGNTESRVDGWDGPKPYSLQAGKKTYLSDQGVFFIRGSLAEILEYGVMGQAFTCMSDPSPADGSEDNQPESEYEYSLKYIVSNAKPGKDLPVNLKKTIGSLLHSRMTAINTMIQQAWNAPIDQGGIIAVAWIDSDPENVQSESLSRVFLKRILSGDNDQSYDDTVSFLSNSKRFPVFLMVNPEGGFFPLQDSYYPGPAFREALMEIIRGNNSALESVLKQSPNLISQAVNDCSLLHYACLLSRAEAVQTLLKAGCNPASKIEQDVQAIHLAASMGDTDTVRQLLAAGIKVDSDDRDGMTPLHYCAISGHLETAKILIDSGAKIKKENEMGENAFFLAAKFKHPAMIRAFVEKGAKLDLSPKNKQILLQHSILSNDFETADFLLKNGAKADIETYGYYPIQYASDSVGPIIRMLIAAGANPNQKGKKGATPLFQACKGNMEGVIAFVEGGADVNATIDFGLTPLHYAIVYRQLPITQYLLDHGAKVNVKTKEGLPIIAVATSVGNREGLNALIASGATCQMDEATALPIMEHAFRYDIPEVVDITLSQCINADFKFYKQFPAYWVADYYQSQTVKELLIERGFDPSTMQEPPFTPFKEVRDQFKIVHQSPLEYPSHLQDKYGQFSVKVELIIDTDGSVILPRIVENPAKEMDRGILEGLRKWKANPLVVNGQPAITRVIAPFSFVPTPPVETIYEIDDVQIKPTPYRQVVPEYPRSLKKQNVDGQVVVVIVVDRKGNVINPKIEVSSHPEFEKPALDAIVKWKFHPGYVNGKPVSIRVRAPLVFRTN